MAGYRQFQTGEVLTAANVNGFLMNQAVMVFADDAARTTALAGVLTEGMLTYNKDTQRLQVYDGTEWKAVGVAEIEPVVATGGDDVYEIMRGDVVYKVHKFTGAGNFVVTEGGLVEALVVAGGGGGAGSNVDGRTGGGGAGGLITLTHEVTPQTYTVIIGAGGTAGAVAADGGQGNDSSVFGTTALGGGRGATDASSRVGYDGGSGGGCSANVGTPNPATRQPGRGVAGQGNDAVDITGGGAGGSGSDGGVWLDFDGNASYYAWGGLGGDRDNFANRLREPKDGYGNGGDSAWRFNSGNHVGARGGDGVVIIRYPVRYV